MGAKQRPRRVAVLASDHEIVGRTVHVLPDAPHRAVREQVVGYGRMSSTGPSLGM